MANDFYLFCNKYKFNKHLKGVYLIAREKLIFVRFRIVDLKQFVVYRIERSRTLIPKLLQISRQDTINEQDIYDCYDNLFTMKNLRLVHIVCHDKGSHK